MRLFHGVVPYSEAANLGVFLEIEQAIVRDLTVNKDPRGMMTAVLSHWLDYGKDRSWRKLAEAVEYIDYKVIAEKIRSEYAVEVSDTKPQTTSEQITHCMCANIFLQCYNSAEHSDV